MGLTMDNRAGLLVLFMNKMASFGVYVASSTPIGGRPIRLGCSFKFSIVICGEEDSGSSRKSFALST
jgi:hypothetical protein